MNEDDSMKDEGKWTRDDLPRIGTPNPAHDSVVEEALDTVVHWLNKYYPKPSGSFAVMLEDTHRAQRERDAAVARAERAEQGAWQIRFQQAVANLLDAERSRDEWKARAEALEAEAEEAFEQGATWHKEQSTPAVSRADIEKAMADAAPGLAPYWACIDAVYALVSGDDPAVHVVRESDIAAVKVTEHAAGWSAESKHLVSGWGKGKHLSVDMDIDRYRAELLNALAVQRAIEAEQAVGPVEAKARELHEVATPAPYWTWEALGEHAREPYRRIAAHVLRQEAGE